MELCLLIGRASHPDLQLEWKQRVELMNVQLRPRGDLQNCGGASRLRKVGRHFFDIPFRPAIPLMAVGKLQEGDVECNRELTDDHQRWQQRQLPPSAARTRGVT